MFAAIPWPYRTRQSSTVVVMPSFVMVADAVSLIFVANVLTGVVAWCPEIRNTWTAKAPFEAAVQVHDAQEEF